MKRHFWLFAIGVALPGCERSDDGLAEAGPLPTELVEEIIIDAPEPPPSPDLDVAAVSDDGVVFRFAAPSEAAAILTADDEYTAQTQAIENGIRAADPAVTRFDQVKPGYAADVLPWPDVMKAQLITAIEASMPTIDQIDQNLPREILLVLTGDRVEGGLPHTRANAIIFAGGEIEAPDRSAQSLFLHELHHVMSRANQDLHDDYFALIGFEPCALEVPESLHALRLTNPDAPTNRHYVPVAQEGADGVVPYLYATGPYDPEVGGTLSQFFGFGLLPVRLGRGQGLARRVCYASPCVLPVEFAL
ncbi:MAG: hypothetical protein AAF788_06275 [Pseudomonadota bacterium]